MSESLEVVPRSAWIFFLRRIRLDLLAAGIPILFLLALGPVPSAAALTPAGRLVVDESSHVVVMEYEAWFGPNAATFQGSAAMPLLQSKDMKKSEGVTTAPTRPSFNNTLPGWSIWGPMRPRAI